VPKSTLLHIIQWQEKLQDRNYATENRELPKDPDEGQALNLLFFIISGQGTCISGPVLISRSKDLPTAYSENVISEKAPCRLQCYDENENCEDATVEENAVKHHDASENQKNDEKLGNLSPDDYISCRKVTKVALTYLHSKPVLNLFSCHLSTKFSVNSIHKS
jgi:hypothetical protein